MSRRNYGIGRRSMPALQVEHWRRAYRNYAANYPLRHPTRAAQRDERRARKESKA